MFVFLWKEDYSGLKCLFDQWCVDGVIDLCSYLFVDFSCVQVCVMQICVVDVNWCILEWYEVCDLVYLVVNLDKIFWDDMFDIFIDEMVQLWNGGMIFFSYIVNYILGGKWLDIQFFGCIMFGSEESWDYVLLVIENVIECEMVCKKFFCSENYVCGLFEYLFIFLWVEDFSVVKCFFDDLYCIGIIDFCIFMDVYLEFVECCMQEICVIDVNLQILFMFGVLDKVILFLWLFDVFCDDMCLYFNEQLIELWNGNLLYYCEVVNYLLIGEIFYVYLQFFVFFGYENNWDLVLVVFIDIIVCKKVEVYLEFFGKYDELIKLYNCVYMVDELNCLECKGFFLVSVIVVDFNGLKEVNDELGYVIGDVLLCCVGEVLGKVVECFCSVVWIGGDEFVILLLVIDECGCQLLMDQIQKLVEVNNQYYLGVLLSLLMGVVIGVFGECLEQVVQWVDSLMYEVKCYYYVSMLGFECCYLDD